MNDTISVTIMLLKLTKNTEQDIRAGQIKLITFGIAAPDKETDVISAKYPLFFER